MGLVLKDKDLLSFSDCPNHCVNGKLFDPYRHEYRECEYCAKKRTESLRDNIQDSNGETILDKLRIGKNLTGYSFDVDTVFIEDKDENIFDELKDEMQEVIEKVSVGDLPDYSILFDFNNIAFTERFINPLILRSYMASINISPLVYAHEVLLVRNSIEYNTENTFNFTFKDLLEYDLVVVKIEIGASIQSILAVSSLLEMRGVKGKPTIIVSSFYRTIYNRFSNRELYNYEIAKLLSVVSLDELNEKQIKEEHDKIDEQKLKAMYS